MTIIATVCVSLSEINMVHPEFTAANIKDEQTYEQLKQVLYSVGVDTRQEIHIQNVQHRNRFNQVVDCPRFLGEERTDAEWLATGLASQESKDKACGSKLVADMYRFKNQY